MVKGTMGRKMSATDACGWYTAVAAKHASTAPLAPRLGAMGLSELRREARKRSDKATVRNAAQRRRRHCRPVISSL